MGSSGRDERNRDTNPGPGMYDANLPRSNNGATITGKPQDKNRNDSPGPGSYNENPSAVKASNPSSGFSKAGLGSGSGAGGNADNRDFGNSKLGSGVSHGFGKGEGQPGHDLNPGPGYYYVPVTFADVPRYVLPVQNEEFKWV